MRAARDYNGKTVIVTGAGGGLGAALCERFARAGAKVGGLDISESGLQRTASRLAALPGAFLPVECDITNEESVQQGVAAIEAELGPAYVLINNAGITHIRNFAAGETKAIERVMAINFMGTVHATAAAFESIVAGGGQFLAISSVSGYAPLVGRTGYCASKHALHGFFNTLRTELVETNASVLLICPSYIATDIHTKFVAGDQKHDDISVGDFDTPEQVADQIFKAAAANKREIATGFVGRLSRYLWRFTPRLYEGLMLRNVAREN